MAGGHLMQALMRWARGAGHEPVGPRTFAVQPSRKFKGPASVGLWPRDARGQYQRPVDALSAKEADKLRRRA